MTNTLYYGDNLDILQRIEADESVPDLLAGKKVDMPVAGQQSVTFKKAPKRKSDRA